MAKAVYWLSHVGACEICDQPLTTLMVDGKTNWGPWALMCVPCHTVHGGKLGLGIGQKYEKQQDGRWLKVAG